MVTIVFDAANRTALDHGQRAIHLKVGQLFTYTPLETCDDVKPHYSKTHVCDRSAGHKGNHAEADHGVVVQVWA